MTRSPFIVALDGMSASQCSHLMKKLRPYVAGGKFNDQLFESGMTLCNETMEKGGEAFADAKLHDIPNTMRNSAAKLNKSTYISAHISAGVSGLVATRAGAPLSKILGISVLTSLNQTASSRIYGHRKIREVVLECAYMAEEAGIFGIVCSGMELELLQNTGRLHKLRAVVPGTRPAGAQTHDQERVVTPVEALKNGAYRLVVGRDVTGADDPVEAIKRINDLCIPHWQFATED